MASGIVAMLMVVKLMGFRRKVVADLRNHRSEEGVEEMGFRQPPSFTSNTWRLRDSWWLRGGQPYWDQGA